MKSNKIQFTNISDVQLIDSLFEISNWCNPNGCLKIFGQIKFPIDCFSACQLYQINKFEILNTIKPIIEINLNSTLNISYNIQLDAFTISKRKRNSRFFSLNI